MTPVRKRIIVGVGLALAALMAVYVGLVLTSGDTARDGTTVQGVPIGGMTPEQAAEALEASLGKTAAKKLRLTALDQTFVVKPVQAGLTLDAAASVAPVSYTHLTLPTSDLV